jgi:hypothetical protein
MMRYKLDGLLVNWERCVPRNPNAFITHINSDDLAKRINEPRMCDARNVLLWLATWMGSVGCTAGLLGNPLLEHCRDRLSPNTENILHRENPIRLLSSCADTAAFIWRLFGGERGLELHHQIERFTQPRTTAHPEASTSRSTSKARNIGSMAELMRTSFFEESKRFALAQISASVGNDRHSFMLARCGDHFAIYQSWVSRWFLFQNTRGAMVDSLWEMRRQDLVRVFDSIFEETPAHASVFGLENGDTIKTPFAFIDGDYDYGTVCALLKGERDRSLIT